MCMHGPEPGQNDVESIKDTFIYVLTVVDFCLLLYILTT